VHKARALGHSHVYCGTATAVTLLLREGWSEIEHVEHEGQALFVFRKAAA